MKFRKVGECDVPLPLYVSDAIGKHLADYGAIQDGYLFRFEGTSEIQRLVIGRTVT